VVKVDARMRRWGIRVWLASLLGVTAAFQPEWARADETIPAEHKLAVGVKLGVIPPIFTVPELVVRPAPHLALGVFGIYTSGAGFGQGAARTSIGGEAIYEFREGRQATGYFSVSYDYYHAAPNGSGFYETSQSGYLTGGIMAKGRFLDLYAGGGLIFLLSDEKPPCTEFCISIVSTPPVLPTIELGARVAFL
jgi:hypothetical protein